MENFVSFLESVYTSWLTPSFPTWAMDMILAFMCGLGIFHLILPLLPLNSSSTPPAENITAKKVKRAHSKVRMKIRTVKGIGAWGLPHRCLISCFTFLLKGDFIQSVVRKQVPPYPTITQSPFPAYRGSRKKPKEDKVLVSLLHRMLRRLVSTISFCQLLRQDYSAEESNPEASRAHQPPMHHKEENVATNLFLEASSAPLKEHLLPKGSKILSPVLLNGPASIESQLPGSATQPPETLTPGRFCSPPLAQSHPSHPPDAVAYPPSMPHPRIAGLQCDPKALGTPQSTPLPDLPSQMPITAGINYPQKSNQTTTDINHMRKPSMSIPGIDKSCRPTQTTAGLDDATRHSPTRLGLNNTYRPTYTFAGLTSCKPTSNIPGHECSIRPIWTSPGLYHYSRHTSTTPELNTIKRPNSTMQGLKNSSIPAINSPGLEYSSRVTSTADRLDNSSSPSSRSPGLNNSKEPPSSTIQFNYSNSPTSPTQGVANSNRPESGSSLSNISAKFQCQSISSHSESSQECLPISQEDASFCTDPTYRYIEASEPTFINPDVQEMLEFQIHKRVHLNVWKDNGKKRNDDALGSMLGSWSSKQTITTSRTFCSRNCQSEQLAGNHQFYYQNVSGNHVQMTCSQFFWGLPFLHSESLVTTVNMVQSPLDTPSIFFNGFIPYITIQCKSAVPEQLISPKPLLHQLIQSHPVIPKMSDSRSPVAGILTQACDPTSVLKPQCHPPPVMNNGASYSNASRYHLSVPIAIQDLEKHLMKKQQESRSNLPDRVKKSHEAFLQITSEHCVSQCQRPHFHFPGEIVDPELQKHLEQHLNKRFYQLHGRWPHRAQQPLDRKKYQEESSGMGQAEVNCGNSCPSSLTDDTSQYPQSISPTFSEIGQSPMEPCKDLINCPATTLKDLGRSPEGSLGKDLEIISNAEVETSYLRHPESDRQSISAEVPRKELLEGTLQIHSSSRWNHTDNSKMPLEKTSCHDLAPCKNDSNGPSFLNPSTQKFLEAHLTRRLVRHRWSLLLRGLKTIHIFNRNKAASLPLSRSSNLCLSFGDSRDDSILLKASVQDEPFQPAQEEKVLKGDSTVESTKHPPAEIQLEFPRATLQSDNSGPSETCATIHEDSMTSGSTPHSFIGRAWHCSNVFKSRTSNLESTSKVVKIMRQSLESKQVSLGGIHQGVSVRNISKTSQSPMTRNRELEEVEDKEPCDWALTMTAQEVASSPTNNKHLRDFKSLETTERPFASRTTDQAPEVSGLSTSHCSAPGVVLQDCATGTFYHDCAPEVLLAADILASRASQSSHKTVSTRKSSCQHRHHFPSREGTVPMIFKSQVPWTNHIFGTNNQKEEYISPRQKVRHSGPRPTQVYNSQSHAMNLGEKIKSFVFSIFNPKEKVMENPRPRVRDLSSPTQIQERVVNRSSVPQQVAKAEDLMTSASWVPVEKQKVHCRRASSINYQEAPKASGSGHICRHGIPTAESKITQRTISSVQKASDKVIIQPSTNKQMLYSNNGTQLLRQHVYQAAMYQRMGQAAQVTKTSVHCPRHCRCRNALYGKENCFS